MCGMLMALGFKWLISTSGVLIHNSIGVSRRGCQQSCKNNTQAESSMTPFKLGEIVCNEICPALYMACIYHPFGRIRTWDFKISNMPILLPINPPATLLHFPICVAEKSSICTTSYLCTRLQLIWNISLEICVDELVLHTLDLYWLWQRSVSYSNFVFLQP